MTGDRNAPQTVKTDPGEAIPKYHLQPEKLSN